MKKTVLALHLPPGNSFAAFSHCDSLKVILNPLHTRRNFIPHFGSAVVKISADGWTVLSPWQPTSCALLYMRETEKGEGVKCLSDSGVSFRLIRRTPGCPTSPSQHLSTQPFPSSAKPFCSLIKFTEASEASWRPQEEAALRAKVSPRL